VKVMKTVITFYHRFDSEEKCHDIIPELLEMWCINYRNILEGSRTEFSLTLNPTGTIFKKRFGKRRYANTLW